MLNIESKILRQHDGDYIMGLSFRTMVCACLTRRTWKHDRDTIFDQICQVLVAGFMNYAKQYQLSNVTCQWLYQAQQWI